ncbi:spore germination protein GerPE [Pontibacillus salicampi]|uniref:Spore germination protein GerPE n=1 Tax=Pontibacillus salicampi TaxID=1449801 RepID=A0ABV6LR12_9BACI
MNKRISRVNQVQVISVNNSSIFEIGDGTEADLNAKVLAVQKEGATFGDEDFPFSDFPIYEAEFPRLKTQPVITQEHIPCCPYINVNSVDIFGLASSSLFQIGNLNTIEGDARVKNFRILQEDEGAEGNDNELRA